jgi:hypothetical protein
MQPGGGIFPKGAAVNVQFPTKKKPKKMTLNIQSFFPEVVDGSALSQAATRWR